jgi:hypothetical protein
MAKAKTLVVDGITYVPEGSAEPKNSNIKIVILQRGWIVVGRWSQDGDKCSLDNAYVVRSWGTSAGIGQLALEGRQASTKLDKAGHMEFHQLTVVATIDAREDLWKNELV